MCLCGLVFLQHCSLEGIEVEFIPFIHAAAVNYIDDILGDGKL